MYLVKISNKLFYKKYLYCLEIKNPFYALFRNNNKDYIKRYIDILNLAYYKGRSKPFTNSEVQGLPLWLGDKLKSEFISPYKFQLAYEIYNYLVENENCTVRVEYPSSVRLYTNNKGSLVKLANKVKGQTPTLWEPEEDNIPALLANPNAIWVRKGFPYKYKVSFTPNAKSTPAIASWCSTSNQKQQIKITTNTLILLHTRKWLEGRFFYVRDDATMTLVTLMMPDMIGKVEKLLYNDK